MRVRAPLDLGDAGHLMPSAFTVPDTGVPGLTALFRLGPPDTYRFVESFAATDADLAPFHAAMGDLTRRLVDRGVPAMRADGDPRSWTARSLPWAMRPGWNWPPPQPSAIRPRGRRDSRQERKFRGGRPVHARGPRHQERAPCAAVGRTEYRLVGGGHLPARPTQQGRPTPRHRRPANPRPPTLDSPISNGRRLPGQDLTRRLPGGPPVRHPHRRPERRPPLLRRHPAFWRCRSRWVG